MSDSDKISKLTELKTVNRSVEQVKLLDYLIEQIKGRGKIEVEQDEIKKALCELKSCDKTGMEEGVLGDDICPNASRRIDEAAASATANTDDTADENTAALREIFKGGKRRKKKMRSKRHKTHKTKSKTKSKRRSKRRSKKKSKKR